MGGENKKSITDRGKSKHKGLIVVKMRSLRNYKKSNTVGTQRVR